MKKHLFFVLGLALLASCTESENTDPAVDPSDLDANGNANCYVVYDAGDYHFDGTVRGNGAVSADIPLSATGVATASASLVWESAKGLVTEVSFDGIEISFHYDGSKGNAVIAALDSDGAVAWSWHIWAPEDKLTSVTAKNDVEICNLNLGALTAELGEGDDTKCYGLLYQWGRKDPFPSSPTRTGDASTVGYPVYNAEGEELSIGHSSWYSTVDNTLEYAIANPTVCLSNFAQSSTGISYDWLKAEDKNDHLWGETKTIFDPCPAGYSVPAAKALSYFTKDGGYTVNYSDIDVADINGDGVITAADYNCGWHFNVKEGSLFFPAAARYDGSYAMLYGSKSGVWGNYWSCTPATEETASFFQEGTANAILAFDHEETYDTVSPLATGSKADAYSVRCVKEGTVISE